LSWDEIKSLGFFAISMPLKCILPYLYLFLHNIMDVMSKCPMSNPFPRGTGSIFPEIN
jgi:hypothetical protein